MDRANSGDSRQFSPTRSKAISREDFVRILCSAIASSIPATVTSPALNRTQIQAEFIHSYLPESRTRYPQFEWLQQIAPESPALSCAIDAWCLSELGRRKKDLLVQQAGTSAYFRAQYILSKSDKGKDDVAQLIGTLHVLQTCDFFSANNIDGLRWQTHAKEILPLLDRLERGLMEPGTSALINFNSRWFLLWHVLLSRRRLTSLKFLGAPEVGPFMGHLAELSSLSFQIPGILQDCDVLCRHQSTVSASRISHLLEDIFELDSRLHAWMAARYQETEAIMPKSIRLTDAAFTCFNSSSSVVLTAYDYTDISAALSHHNYWICLLVLSQAQWHVFNTFTDFDADNVLRTRLQLSCKEYANRLCMSVSYLRKDGRAWGLLAAIGPLYFASLFYMKSEMFEELAWCANAAMELENQGIRTPFSRSEDG